MTDLTHQAQISACQSPSQLLSPFTAAPHFVPFLVPDNGPESQAQASVLGQQRHREQRALTSCGQALRAGIHVAARRLEWLELG